MSSNRLTRDIRPYLDLKPSDDRSSTQVRLWWGVGNGSPLPEDEYNRVRVAAPIYTGAQWLGGVHKAYRCVTDAMSHDMARLRYVPVDGNWGGARRKVAGSNSWSTHAFLCATDTHAPQNPMSSAFVTDMPPELIEAWLSIRTVATNERVLMWGGFWSRPDAMHTNANCSPSVLAQGVRTRDGSVFSSYGDKGPTLIIGGDTGVYALGSKAAQVREIQRLLIHAGLLPVRSDDGEYGPFTEEAVRRWQNQIGVTPDGVWGPATEAATRKALAATSSIPVVVRPGIESRSEADNTVMLVYRKALGRAPSEVGRRVWTERLMSGEATPTELEALLRSIPEGQEVARARIEARVKAIESAVTASFVERFGVAPTPKELTTGVTEVTTRLAAMKY